MTTTRQPLAATRPATCLKPGLVLRTTLSIMTLYVLTGGAAQAASPVTNYEYDANGNRTKVTDGLNHASVSAYDALNRLVKVTDANLTYVAIDLKGKPRPVPK